VSGFRVDCDLDAQQCTTIAGQRFLFGARVLESVLRLDGRRFAQLALISTVAKVSY
jgi:hypothetical protein